MAARDALSAKPPHDNKKEKAEKGKTENCYRQPDVRDALGRLFHGKCAYCESQIKHIGYPHIEHFRPKDSFPKCCFEWENLLSSCPVCNGKGWKGTKFPDAAAGGTFINPCVDDPNEHFDFIFEEAPGTLPFFARVKPKTLRGETTEYEIGLNRIDLLRERSHFLVFLYPFIAAKASEGDEEARGLLKMACSPHFTYSAFAKSLKKQFLEE